MAIRGNAFALLEGDGDAENLFDRVLTMVVKAAAAAAAADYSVNKQSSNPRSHQPSSALQGSLVHENRNGFDRQNRNCSERESRNNLKFYNRNGVERNGIERQSRNRAEENGSQQNNRNGRNNGYRHNGNGWKRLDEPSNGHQKKEEASSAISNGQQKKEDATNAESNVQQKKEAGSNGDQKGLGQQARDYATNVESNSQQKKRGTDQKGKEQTDDEGWQTVARHNNHKPMNAYSQAPRQKENNVSRRVKYYGRRREIHNGKVSEDKQSHGENGVNMADIPSKEETRNRMRNPSVGTGNGRINRGSYQRRVERLADENGKGKNSESKELLNKKGLDSDETPSKEGGSSKGKQEETEKAERQSKKLQETEAKIMTLKQYEKQREEKRKALESMKTEERRVTPDTDFNSMQIIAKKNEENLAADKQKKKVANNGNTSAKAKKMIISPPPSSRRGGRYPRGDENRHGVSSDCPEGSGNVFDAPLPKIKDDKQFPALVEGATKRK